LGPVRLVVDAALAARLPLEVLDGVRDVDAAAVDAGGGERLVKDAPCRPDEGTAREILPVARLLADEHQLRTRRAFAEDGLRRVPPELAGAAVGGVVGESREVRRGHAAARRRRRLPLAATLWRSASIRS